jgi:hypothetical protein
MELMKRRASQTLVMVSFASVRKTFLEPVTLLLIAARGEESPQRFATAKFRHRLETHCAVIGEAADERGARRTPAPGLPGKFMSSRPSVMGPMRSSPPSDCHAAELMLLSVVDAKAATLCC